MIRLATKQDAAGMLEIYSVFISESGITQETEIPSLADFQQRILVTLKERPWLVCETDGRIAGYAYAGRHRERKGYQWCTEPSIYLHKKFYGYQVATALYTALFDILKLQGYVNAYAVITLPNERSVAFHEKFGFSYLTTFKKIGYKLGQWHDVGWWEKTIYPHEAVQKEPVSITAIDPSLISSILQKAADIIKK